MIEETLGAAVYPTDAEIKAQPVDWYLGADELVRRSPTAGSTSTPAGVRLRPLRRAPRRGLPARIAGAGARDFVRDPVPHAVADLPARQVPRRHPRPAPLPAVRISRALDDPAFVESQVRDYQAKVFAMDPAGDVNGPLPGRRRLRFRQAKAALEPPTSSA